MHWLDVVIATLEKEAFRWQHSDGSKAESHATAVAILKKVVESGVTHDEVKARLAEPDASSASPSSSTVAGDSSALAVPLASE